MVAADSFLLLFPKHSAELHSQLYPKKKSGVRLIAVGKELRRLIAECLANEANSEAIELADCLQLGTGTSGGDEANIHPSQITYDNIVSAQSHEGVLQIDFQNAFDLVKRS